MSDRSSTAAANEGQLKVLEQAFGEAQMARAPYEGVWYLNLAYFAGDQWLCWDGNRLYKPRLRAGRILITDNRIQPAVRTEIAKMTKQSPAWACTPTATKEEVLEGARRAERIMEAKWGPDELGLSAKLFDALEWSRTCGAGFWKTTWDSSLGAGTEVLVGPDGKIARNEDQSPMQPELLEALPEDHPVRVAFEKKTVNRGEVSVEVRSPLELFPDPLASSMEDCERMFEEVVLSPEKVHARFGVELKPDAEFTAGIVEARLSAGAGRTSAGRKRGVRVRELWELSTPKHKNGRHVVWAGGKILIDEENPYRDDEGNAYLPYVMFPGVGVPGRFWPTSIVEQLRPIQTELNKIKSQIAENRNRIGNPALLKSRQANVKYSGLPGEEVLYDDTTQNAIPQYLQPPEMPGYVQMEVQAMETAIQEISGQHEVSSGTVPNGVTAAAAINLLQQQDDTKLGPAIKDMESAISLAGQQVLRLISRFYTDERVIRIAGDDDHVMVMRIKGDMLCGQAGGIRVTEGSMKPKSQAAKQAAMQDMFNLMIQYGIRFDQRSLRKFFMQYEVGGLEALLGDIDRDEAQVNREIRRMYELERIPVNPDVDNHEAHIAGLQEEMKTSRYEDAVRANPAVAVIFTEHLKTHKDAQQAAMAQQMAQMMPPGADPNGPPPQIPGAGSPAGGQVDIASLLGGSQ